MLICDAGYSSPNGPKHLAGLHTHTYFSPEYFSGSALSSRNTYWILMSSEEIYTYKHNCNLPCTPSGGVYLRHGPPITALHAYPTLAFSAHPSAVYSYTRTTTHHTTHSPYTGSLCTIRLCMDKIVGYPEICSAQDFKGDTSWELV